MSLGLACLHGDAIALTKMVSIRPFQFQMLYFDDILVSS